MAVCHSFSAEMPVRTKDFSCYYLITGLLALGMLIALAGTPTLQAQAPQPLAVQSVHEAMARATHFMTSIATEGGYVYLYTPDLAKRTAERPASVTQIAIQPPGTPSMGLAFLRAYETTGDAVHLDAARSAAMALVRSRLALSGGWHATADFDPARPNEDGRLYNGEKYVHGQIIKHTIHTTFDDGATQTAVLFLLEFVRVTKDSKAAEDAKIREALDLALAGMMRAQYPNGAWPQSYDGKARDPKDYPVKKAHIPQDYLRQWPDADYTSYYTLNDNCHSDCVRVMLLASKLLGKQEYLASARRGADFLLLAQLPEPQPAWAQQYDFDMVPAWARTHEGPSVSSMESGNVIKALIDIYAATGEKKYLDAAGPAVAWLKRSSINGSRWWRLYELGTNRPIFGDERGTIVYEKGELSRKFAEGYVWNSQFKIPAILAEYERVKSGETKTAETDLPRLEQRAREVLTSLDEKGRWLSKERWKKGAAPQEVISTKTFIRNLGILSDYLEALPKS